MKESKTPETSEYNQYLSLPDSLAEKEDIHLRTQVAEYLIAKIQEDGFIVKRTGPYIAQEGAFLAIQTANGYKYHTDMWKNSFHPKHVRPSEQLSFSLLCNGHVSSTERRNYHMTIWNLTRHISQKSPQRVTQSWPTVYTDLQYQKDITEKEVQYLQDLLTSTTDYETTNTLFADPSSLRFGDFDSVEWIRAKNKLT